MTLPPNFYHRTPAKPVLSTVPTGKGPTQNQVCSHTLGVKSLAFTIDTAFPNSHQSRERAFAKLVGMASATDSVMSGIKIEGIHPSEPTPEAEVRSMSVFRT